MVLHSLYGSILMATDVIHYNVYNPMNTKMPMNHFISTIRFNKTKRQGYIDRFLLCPIPYTENSPGFGVCLQNQRVSITLLASQSHVAQPSDSYCWTVLIIWLIQGSSLHLIKCRNTKADTGPPHRKFIAVSQLLFFAQQFSITSGREVCWSC